MLPSAQAVLDALDSCVLYQVKGPYRSEATGLSCYYSYNGDADEAVSYAGLGAGTAFKYPPPRCVPDRTTGSKSRYSPRQSGDPWTPRTKSAKAR